MSLVNKPGSASEVEANQGYGLLDERLRREHRVELIGANRKKRRKRPQYGGHSGYLRRSAVCLAQELSPLEQRLGTVEPFMKLLLEASTELLNTSTVAFECTYVIHNTE